MYEPPEESLDKAVYEIRRKRKATTQYFFDDGKTFRTCVDDQYAFQMVSVRQAIRLNSLGETNKVLQYTLL